jgi:hypothetical protein
MMEMIGAGFWLRTAAGRTVGLFTFLDIAAGRSHEHAFPARPGR